MVETGGYDGAFYALVPGFNSLVNLFHYTLRNARTKLSNVEQLAYRSAEQYTQTDAGNADEMQILRQQLPGPTEPAPRPPAPPGNEYRDVADPIAALDLAPSPSGAPRASAAVRRLDPLVLGVNPLWREEVGGHLYRELFQPAARRCQPGRAERTPVGADRRGT